jgi:hypothetical protein
MASSARAPPTVFLGCASSPQFGYLVHVCVCVRVGGARQLDIDEFRLLLAACEAPITEEEFCMLVDKYDVNEDRFISDTELLAHVRSVRRFAIVFLC